MSKFFNHLKTIRRHRKEVRKLCFKCGLYRQGLFHDLSKYSPSEFFPSVRYWTGNRSPIDNQIEVEGYSEAWLHHKGRNKHHYEYWIDPIHGENGILCPIPYRFLAEMFCDRVAACKTYMKEKYMWGSALTYFQKRRPKEKKLINPESYKELERFLLLLATEGEDKVCEEIRKILKGEKI